MRTKTLYRELRRYRLSRKEAREFVKMARQNRREQKDRSEMFGAVASWCEDNRAAVKSLERLLGELRKIENRHASRFYTPRTDAWDGLREPSTNE